MPSRESSSGPWIATFLNSFNDFDNLLECSVDIALGRRAGFVGFHNSDNISSSGNFWRGESVHLLRDTVVIHLVRNVLGSVKPMDYVPFIEILFRIRH